MTIAVQRCFRETRCKACHGWDRRGTDGGYVRRSREETRPNAGTGDGDSTSREIVTGTEKFMAAQGYESYEAMRGISLAHLTTSDRLELRPAPSPLHRAGESGSRGQRVFPNQLHWHVDIRGTRPKRSGGIAQLSVST